MVEIYIDKPFTKIRCKFYQHGTRRSDGFHLIAIGLTGRLSEMSEWPFKVAITKKWRNYAHFVMSKSWPSPPTTKMKMMTDCGDNGFAICPPDMRERIFNLFREHVTIHFHFNSSSFASLSSSSLAGRPALVPTSSKYNISYIFFLSI